jgi:lysophospholipase L1-like esterase
VSSSPNTTAASTAASSSYYQNPTCWRALVVASVLAIVHVSRQQQQTVSSYLHMNEELEHRFFANGNGANGGSDPQRCVEDLDLGLGKATQGEAAATAANCRCVDPLIPMPKKFPKWLHRHEELTKMASGAAMDGAEVVLVGDSIVEHFSGTRDMGRQQQQQLQAPPANGDPAGGDERDDDNNEQQDSVDELRVQAQAFAKFAASANLVALGCSGDTTNQLMFHLNYGMLPPQLQPKIWIVAIGTNNLGSGCNARTTLAGVLQVAQYLHQQRPDSIVVVHGLFPRSDERHQEGPLRRYWGQILWINQQLKKFCSLHSEWRYFDVNNFLLERMADAPMKVALKPGLLPDGLHPSVEGYKVWSAELSELITKLLSDDEDEDESAATETTQDAKGRLQKGKKGHDRRALLP